MNGVREPLIRFVVFIPVEDVIVKGLAAILLPSKDWPNKGVDFICGDEDHHLVYRGSLRDVEYEH